MSANVAGHLLRITLFGVLLAPAMVHATTALHVIYDKTHQRIDGFGASDAWSIDPVVGKWLNEGREAQVEALADQLFSVDKGIGLSAWRFNIGAGSAEQGDKSAIPDPYRRAQLLIAAPDANVDMRKQAGQIRFLQEARERGVDTFVAFANSPPTWATKNGLTHPGAGEGIASTNLAPQHIDNFSRFLVDVLQYLRGPGVNVPVNYVSPANEPTWHWQGQSQEGNRYNNEDLKQLYKSLDRELHQAGLANVVEIDGVEVPEYRAALNETLQMEFSGAPYTEGMNDTPYGSFRNYIDTFLGEEEMREILGNKLSLHAYYSEESQDRLGRLRDLMAKNVQEASPDARLWMSEYCVLGEGDDVRTFEGPGFDVDDMAVAIHIARIIHRDLTRLDVSAWFWWLALTPYDYKDGLLKIDPDLNPDSVRSSRIMWVLGHFSRFIRPGYERVDLPAQDDLFGLMASAYRSPVGDELVVVVVNADTSERAVKLDINKLPTGVHPAAGQIYITDAKGVHREGHATDIVKLPAQSVATLVVPLVLAN